MNGGNDKAEAHPGSLTLGGGPFAQDPVLRWMAGLMGLAAVPILVPFLSEEWRVFYGLHIVSLPLLGVVLVAIRTRLSDVTEETERRFWNLLTLSFASLFVAEAISVVVTDSWIDSPTIRQFVEDGPYLMFYGALAAALDTHPKVRSPHETRGLRALDRVGSFVLLFGLLSYFLVLPGLSSQGSSTFLSSSLALFVALDAYVVLRLWHLRGAASTSEWRSIYTCLMAGAAMWTFTDLAQSLEYEGILTDPGWGTPSTVIWPLSMVAVVVATRFGVNETGPGPVVEAIRQPLGMGPLAVYALAPLLLHVALYRFGFPDQALRAPRESLVLGVTALLAALALGYHKFLQVENRRLTEQEGRAKQTLAHQAFHDELTGLPNRNMFRDRLRLAIADASRYGRKCALLFCDLDHFKVINDSLGHEAGDRALVTISNRLQHSIREVDTVARLGGDEFAIIMRGVRGALDAAILAEKLLGTVGEPLMEKDRKHVLTASVGIAVYPEDGADEETLLKHADTAMYQAKLHGRNTYRLFEEAMNEAAEERLSIEQGLRTGLIEDNFTVFYQPIAEAGSGRPIGYEALLRWNDPERGFVEPINFIDIAEQTGLIVPIGKWVLETACTWASQMDPTAVDPPSISVNISMRQLRDPALTQDVRRILERTGLAASRLHLEITESMSLTADTTAAVLERLRDLGVRIAIDDFGTGYAALSRLRDLPVDIVKIDRSFVKNIEVNPVSEAIVLAIVRMAKALDFSVIAEGVETQEELTVIQQSECDAVQGFFLCAPMPPEELEEAIACRYPSPHFMLDEPMN